MNQTTSSSEEFPRKAPIGESVNWLVMEIGWPFPTFVAGELFVQEFFDPNIKRSGQLLVNMFNALGAKIDKALAATGGHIESVEFKYWRKLSDAATKMKPLKLRASLYTHPDYGKPWLYVEKA